MGRVRSRRARDRRAAWPEPAADELRHGVDLTRYRSRLGAFFARWARTPEELQHARETEEALAHLYPDDPR